MAQIFKDTTQVEIKCSADKFFETFTSKSYLIPRICPDKVQKCDIIEGDGKTVGSVKFWKIAPVSGKYETAMEKTEAIDLIKKKITLKFTEGIFLNYYKDFKATVEVTTESGKTLATLTVEYEKLNEAIPAPTQYIDLFVAYAKDIGSYFSMT